jgi:hypothetical protein
MSEGDQRADDKRALAAALRRAAAGFSTARDRVHFRELAMQLEIEAAELEAGKAFHLGALARSDDSK